MQPEYYLRRWPQYLNFLLKGGLIENYCGENGMQIEMTISKLMSLGRMVEKKKLALEFKKREKDALLFALVDMDYDFEGRFLIDRRMIDTRPLVTLASHYFAEESSVNSHIRRIINEYSPDYLYPKLSDEATDCIRKWQ